MESVPDLTLYGPQNRLGVIAFNLGKHHAYDVGSFLDNYGEIKGYDYDTYTFYAKKGQKVHVSISNEGADTYLFGPGIDDSVDLSRYSPELDSHGQYSLPASGKYELRVLQTRNDARKN
ncbi:PPC domain-containing protein, partial [Vibrio cholerae]|uniref:PPC domain-containing protein n=1 Tax=Vibrio cholerae TaxID=666 RepID=UPI003132FD3E